MNCNICKQEAREIFKASVLYKYQVSYFQCQACGFIQTEQPYWLAESYHDAIADLDTGYVTRNIYLASITRHIIGFCFNPAGDFVDYGGGYGLFVRLMRDKGFQFFRQDLYCQNIFSKYFDMENKENPKRFELLTAFEVFEHLPEPLEEIEKMLALSGSVLFSTELQPERKWTSASDWWYFMPEPGQHVAIYSKKSLEAIAKKFNCHLYSNNKNLHLLTDKKLSINFVKWISIGVFMYNRILGRYYWNKKSLIGADFNLIKGQWQKRHEELQKQSQKGI